MKWLGALEAGLTKLLRVDASQSFSVAEKAQANVNLGGFWFPPQGRLTLTTAAPVQINNVAAGATVYYSPYEGQFIPLWNVTLSAFVPRVFSELSNVLANSSTGSAGPSAAAASQVYDLYAWDNSGTPTLTRSPAWSAGTGGGNSSRGTGSGSSEQQRIQGLLVNKWAITNGPGAGAGTYLGTVATDASGATVTWNRGSTSGGGGAAWFGVWNNFNRVRVGGCVQDITTSWSYTGAPFRGANGSPSNRVTFVTGQAEDEFAAMYAVRTQITVGTGEAQIGIGLDSSVAIAGRNVPASLYNGTANAALVGLVSHLTDVQPLGLHFVQAVEKSDGTNASYFYGVDGNAAMQLSASLVM